MNTPPRFLGIDPGVATTGFGVIEVHAGDERLIEYGVITTPKDVPLPLRLTMIHNDLAQVIQRHPQIVACGVEELFFSKNAKTAFMVGQARGVILFTVSMQPFTIQEFTPRQVKSAVVGTSSARKEDVQRAIQLLFSLSTLPQPDDAADAIAVAHATAAAFRFTQAAHRSSSFARPAS